MGARRFLGYTWIDFGDTIADSGIENIYAGRPKQWSQSARSFGKYLGYRTLASP